MKTILFDFDGTIADTLPVVFKGFRSTFLHFLDQIYTDQDILNLFGPPEIPILTSLIPADRHESAIAHYLQA